jgi:hypothetical protein
MANNLPRLYKCYIDAFQASKGLKVENLDRLVESKECSSALISNDTN